MTEAAGDFVPVDLQDVASQIALELPDSTASAVSAASPDAEKGSTPARNPWPSKGMLLRLFQSDLFTAAQAAHYLGRYFDAPGIQFYLCNRLRTMPFDEVRFLLPQLW